MPRPRGAPGACLAACACCLAACLALARGRARAFALAPRALRGRRPPRGGAALRAATVAQPAVSTAGFSSEADWDGTPLAELRRQYLEGAQLQTLPRPGVLPPWVKADAVYEIVPHQVQRDIEQLEYLVAEGALPADLRSYVADLVIPEYRRVLSMARLVLDGRSDVYFATRPKPDFALYFGLQKRAIHLHPGDAVAEGAISGSVDLEAVQENFLQREHRAVVIDDFFSGEALQKLRSFLLESTIWTEAKFGHVGAYMEGGFACPLVAQIDQELRAKLPGVLGELELDTAWAYMYDGSLGGVSTHADDAQVQINFFITPTEANLGLGSDDGPSGGLVLYGVGPPDEWGKEKFNNVYARDAIENVIATTNHWNITVPYVQNRAILFDSTYFHRSDDMKFKKGYKNRRINVTFLYGKRRSLQSRAAVGPEMWKDLAGFQATEEAAELGQNRERFYTVGQQVLDDDGWAMLRAEQLI